MDNYGVESRHQNISGNYNEQEKYLIQETTIPLEYVQRIALQ